MRLRWLVACLMSCTPASGTPDAWAFPDGPLPQDGRSVDAKTGGFGEITGDCGVLTESIWAAPAPAWFQGDLDFGTDRYDDPSDRPQLTDGGQVIVSSDNAGGSSIYSEAFAFEWLARCEGAALLKIETDIVYDTMSKKADLLVEIDGRKVGVSVTRFVAFPFGSEYTSAAATELLQRKLDDIELATASVSAADRWSRQLISVLAYDADHANVALNAWNNLPATVRDQTLLIVSVTSGDDLFIYTDQ